MIAVVVALLVTLFQPVPVASGPSTSQGSAPIGATTTSMPALYDASNDNAHRRVDRTQIGTALIGGRATWYPAHGNIAAAGPALIGGRATWYPAHGNIAAAGPALRDYLGPHWRGTLISVRSAAGQVVVVRVSDWCGCHGGGGRLLDLSDDAFRQLAPLDRGVIGVSVQRIGRAPVPPPTDTAP